MPFLGEIFISEILNKPVMDQRGDELGRLKDVSVKPGNPCPLVTGLVLAKRKKRQFIPLSQVELLNRKVISVQAPEKEFPEIEPEAGQILIREQLLDRQIVDINGVKVVRVNDIKLGELDRNFAVVGLDVGFQGLLRRLGWEKTGPSRTLIPWDMIQTLEPGLSHLALNLTRQSLAHMHPVDLAEIIAQISSRERAVLLGSLDKETAGEAIHELDADTRAAIVDQMDVEEAADVLEKMQPDEAADILGDLPDDKAKEILDRMEEEEAADVEELLEHDDDTAGGLMTTEYLCVFPEITAEEAIALIRQRAPEIELIYYIYVVDDQDRLQGVLSLRDLILSAPATTLKEIMRLHPKKITPDTKQKEVAELVSRYNLLAVPVVDEFNHLLGIITVDDILNILIPSFGIKRF
jgi:magnesium transporter